MNDYLERSEFIFGTNVYQKVYDSNSNAKVVLEKAVHLMREFEEKLSFFRDNSEVSEINKNAGKCFTRVSKDTFEILKKSFYYSTITEGLFDITIAPLVKKWAINTENPNVLNDYEVKESLELINYEDVVLNEVNNSVMLLRENQKIDLGGIAKGYIADKIIEFYKENNISSAIINLGGNIKVLGHKDNKTLWRVGISEPVKHSKKSICAIECSNKSIVTSGGYERAFLYKEDLYNHILNPKNGYPSKSDLKSITIVSDDSILGDGLSTALFIMGKDKSIKFMRKNNISGIMITSDDKIIFTRDLIESFKLFKDYETLVF